MDEEDRAELDRLPYTPSSALGSCRYKIADPDVDDTDYKRILEIFKKYDVRYFFYNGGNDSMDTCNKISKYMQKVGYDCRVMGVPKTIDNDLFGTDHCPGFASAAKYIATSVMEVARDAHVYDIGHDHRHRVHGPPRGLADGCGFALADTKELLPATLSTSPRSTSTWTSSLPTCPGCYEKNGNCIVAVSEGIHYADGTLRLRGKDRGNRRLRPCPARRPGGAACQHCRKKSTGAKVRGIELSLLQRCAAHCASQTDIDEAYLSGKTAVEEMLKGTTDKMVGFACDRTNGYKCEAKLFDLADVANFEKKFPREWINASGNNVTADFANYCLPLIQGETKLEKEDGLPRFARLKKVFAK